MHKNSIKKNLLILIISSIATSMLMAGIALSFFIKNNYEETTRASFVSYYERAKSVFKRVHQDTRYYTGELAKRIEITNSLNLISEYSDINAYEAGIYDEEKKRIARQLLNYAKSAHLYEVKIYDKHGWLVSFSRPGKFNQGIVSFENGKPVILILDVNSKWVVSNEQKSIPALYMKNHDRFNESFYTYNEDVAAIESVSEIYRQYVNGNKKSIGHVHVINPINEKVLNSLSKGSSAKHSILLPNKKIMGDDIPFISKENLLKTSLLFDNDKKDGIHEWLDNNDYYIKGYSIPLANGEFLYLISSLGKSSVSVQIDKTVFVIFIVFTISSIILFPAWLLFFKSTIAKPIDEIVRAAKSLEKGNYKNINSSGNTNYEIHVLTDALNSAAETVREREYELRKNKELLEERVNERTQDLTNINIKLSHENIERLQAEAKLEESKKMLQLVMDSIPQFIFWKNRNSRYLGCNENFLQAAGLNNPEDIIGKSDYNLPWTKEESDFYIATDKKIMDTDTAEYNIHETQQTLSGEIIHIETNKVPLHDKDGNVIGILGSYHDITERKNYEENIMHAKEVAENANKAKSEFLSRMSHELRTPLNAILGFAQLLNLDLGKTAGEITSSNIKEIIDAGNHLLRLINEVLDLAKIESGGINLDCENINVYNVIAESIKITQSLADENGLVLESSAGICKQKLIYADETRLKQVFINLITNAIKYNKENGKVTVECVYEKNHWIKFNIKDTGIGISKSNSDKIFNPFERLGVESHGIDGTGIGLVISKELIEHMGGIMGFESKVGEGSTFWFKLPCYTGE